MGYASDRGPSRRHSDVWADARDMSQGADAGRGGSREGAASYGGYADGRPRVAGVQLASARQRHDEPGRAAVSGSRSSEYGRAGGDARAGYGSRGGYGTRGDYDARGDRGDYGDRVGYAAHGDYGARSDYYSSADYDGFDAGIDGDYARAGYSADESLYRYGEQGMFDRVGQTLRAVPIPAYVALVCVLALVVIVPSAIARNASNAAEAAVKEAAEQAEAKAKAAKTEVVSEEEQLAQIDFELTPALFDDIPTDEGLLQFSLSGLKAPEASTQDVSGVNQAIAAIEERGAASVVFVDAETGRGIAYQPDLVVYGASSFKALYSLYVCEEFVEPGAESLDTYRMVNYSVGLDGYAAGSSYSIESLIEGAITQSSNNAFGALRNAFDSQGFDEWVTSLGAKDAVCRADSWFPTYCARSSARLWAEMLAYTSTGTETAQWLGDLTGQTTVSFIRDGLEGTGATVRDKAGWCTDSDPAYNSVSDAGLIEIDGKTYIMSILTGMPDSEANRALVGDLAAALIECRDALDVAEG